MVGSDILDVSLDGTGMAIISVDTPVQQRIEEKDPIQVIEVNIAFSSSTDSGQTVGRQSEA